MLVEYGTLSNAKLRIIPEDDLQNEVAALMIGRIEDEQFLAFSQVNEEFVQLFNDTFQEQISKEIYEKCNQAWHSEISHWGEKEMQQIKHHVRAEALKHENVKKRKVEYEH